MAIDLECIYCDTKFSVGKQPYSNLIAICPCCKRQIYGECEYGFGPVTPCQIYLGEEVVGVVESDDSNYYYLMMNGKKIPLKSTYLDAIYEAITIVCERLHILRQYKKKGLLSPFYWLCKKLGILRQQDHENIQILTKRGSFFFYGDWPGEPYDNYHKIIHASYDGEILEMINKHLDHLLIYNPENITSTEREFKIEKAKKIKLIYDSSDTVIRKNTTVIYTVEGDTLSKETKYGIDHLAIKEPFVAVYLGPDY